MRDVMNVDATETPAPPPCRRTARARKTRKTPVFTIRSPEHQRFALEALEMRLAAETVLWKQRRLKWMLRQLRAAMQVSERA